MVCFWDKVRGTQTLQPALYLYIWFAFCVNPENQIEFVTLVFFFAYPSADITIFMQGSLHLIFIPTLIMSAICSSVIFNPSFAATCLKRQFHFKIKLASNNINVMDFPK